MNKLLVKAILEAAHIYKWQLQGLGMLRLYLSKATRLHIWHSSFSSPGVSTLHTHPWDFKSEVIAGVVTNIRYVEDPSGEPYNSSVLQCGPGGMLTGEPVQTRLLTVIPEVYTEGETYSERAEEIHESKPEDGTVTLVTRVFKPDEDHARVFWPVGTEWGSAIPRDATPEEVQSITKYALNRWFKD